MSMNWLRWYHGTVNDPKWRVISRRANASIPVVLAIWAAMLENASQASPRGKLQGWDHEDVAAALDIDSSEVKAVYDAMQGKTLNGDTLTGWENRQPKRERDDSSAERVRAHRERHKHAEAIGYEQPVTPCNASVTHETPRLDKSREEEINPPNGGLVPGAKPGTPATPHQEIIALYHEILPVCPPVREWNDTRKKYLQARWREKPERQSLEWWRKFFSYVAKSDFLTGKMPGRNNGPPFIADLEWLIKPSNFAKVIEGRYENRGTTTTQH